MTKWHGVIGYIQTQETAPGVFSEVATEYEYAGDVIRNTRRWEQGSGLNDNLTISNQFSIIGDWFSYDNFQSMRYLKWMGASWKILSVELQRPRLLVSVGGVWNG
jgi:hypothetical protein